MQIPICTKGRRACPPEDCGGIWGYEELIEAINNPGHPEHEDMTEWVGEYYDPEYFNLEGTNNLLAEHFQ
ncbi:MAG: plasmid pRiA4b ORF-3 family protein [Planctomycetes bacterium]|nr:plasmid pRiA4b ORF-3 family protein [Planctomycetota bacterium]